MKCLLAFILLSAASRAVEIKEESITYANASFRVAPADLKVVWKNENGEPYRTFDKVQAAISAQGKTVRFLMNAGIFEPGGIPSGIHVEAGKEWLPLNEHPGKGNFFLKPNGIVSCWMGGRGGAVISPLEGWKRRVDLAGKVRDFRKAAFAVQSGPLLLIDGQRHPAFRKNSDSRLHRNGIGVDKDGRFVCAITAPSQLVNFWDFAGLFLELGCKDALFLDGNISQMLVDPAKPFESNPFGAIFVVTD